VTWRLGGPDHGRGSAAGIEQKKGRHGSQGKRTVRGDGGRGRKAGGKEGWDLGMGGDGLTE
jgi:hypothetical protein